MHYLWRHLKLQKCRLLQYKCVHSCMYVNYTYVTVSEKIPGKCTLGFYDTLAFSLHKSESATWCIYAGRHAISKTSSRPSMASSVYKSIDRTRCIQTSINYNILLVYRNQPKHYRTAMICFLQTVVSTDPHSISHNLGKLNASAKIRASHYRAGFALSAGTANWKFIFCAECHILSDTVTYILL